MYAIRTGFFMGCAFITSVLTILTPMKGCNFGRGIHPAPSGQAVYIAGESCTINAELNRSPAEMAEDFQFCVHVHNQYQELGH